jgi:5-methylcytosine-specific restriction endonuclease McrA
MFGYEDNNDEGRDVKRSLNVSEKRAVFEQQNHKCAKCKQTFDFFIFEFHHKKAWSANGRTNVKNTIGLCPTCHKKVHDEERINKHKIKKTTTKKPLAKTKAKKPTAKKSKRATHSSPFELNLPEFKMPKGGFGLF